MEEKICIQEKVIMKNNFGFFIKNLETVRSNEKKHKNIYLTYDCENTVLSFMKFQSWRTFI